MDLYGTFEHSLDIRGKRIVLPAAWRSCLQDALPADNTRALPNVRMLSVTDMLGTHIELHLNAKYLHSTRDYILNQYTGKDQNLVTAQQKLNLLRQINSLVENKEVMVVKEAKKSLQVGFSDREMSVLQMASGGKEVVIVGHGEYCEIWPIDYHKRIVDRQEPMDKLIDLRNELKEYYHRNVVNDVNKFAHFSNEKLHADNNERAG